MFKKIFLVFSVLVLSIFTGCGDEPKAQEKKVKAVAVAPKIEVVQNENAKEIKVVEKEKKKLKVVDGKTYYYDYNIKSGYDQNAQPANEDASVRIKPRTAIDAQVHIRSPYEKIKVSLLVRKLSKKFIVKCSACHNDYANGVIGPSLLNKTSDEILKSITDFKDGTKSNPLMTDLINLMSDDEIKEIAGEIYNFNEEIKKMGK